MTKKQIIEARESYNDPLLYRLLRIPKCDVESGRHSMANCEKVRPQQCCNPVAYKMVIEEWGDSLNTAYWCEEHKPEPMTDEPLEEGT